MANLEDIMSSLQSLQCLTSFVIVGYNVIQGKLAKINIPLHLHVPWKMEFFLSGFSQKREMEETCKCMYVASFSRSNHLPHGQI